MTARDLFVSHSSDDAEAARALRAVLEDAGYTCWMAPDDIVGTETWTEQILAAIADSKAMIVLVSTASNKSPHVSREVNLALGKGRPVLPIRIEDVAPGGSLEYLLSLVQRVDAFPPPVSVHRDRILRRLDTIVARPTGAQAAAPSGAGSAGAASAASAGAASAAAAPPTATPPPPPPAIDLGPAAAAATPGMPARPPDPSPTERIVVTPTSVEMPGITFARPATRSGPPMALLIGGGLVALVAVVIIGAGLLNGPAASTAPSQLAQVSPTPVGTAAASEPAATSGTTAGPLSEDQQRLQDLLPVLSDGSPGCAAWSTPPGGTDVLSPSGYGASMARLTCAGPAGDEFRTEYALYLTKEAMKSDYDAIMTSAGIAAGGACVSAIPANAPWNFPDFPTSGDLGCFERDGRVQYVWTQNELRVLAQWLAPDNPTGREFWQRWTTTPNAAEAELRANLPDSVDDAGACIRAADLYYSTALAILACPRTAPEKAVYYAQFASAEGFPNDPLTSMFDQVMTGGGWPDDTITGPYDDPPTYGRYTWGYSTNGTIGDTEGYIGAFLRTDEGDAQAQYVWTFNRTAVMGLWHAPDLQAGIDFFDDWIAEVR